MALVLQNLQSLEFLSRTVNRKVIIPVTYVYDGVVRYVLVVYTASGCTVLLRVASLLLYSRKIEAKPSLYPMQVIYHEIF